MEILKRGAVPADKIRMWGRLLFGIALAALLCCAWASPFWKMPLFRGGDLDGFLAQVLAEAADEGRFPAAYDEIGSVSVRDTELAAGRRFLLVSGVLETDRGSFPFAALLKKQALTGNWRCDTRYLLERRPDVMEGVSYVFLQYQIRVEADALQETPLPLPGRIGLPLLLLYLQGKALLPARRRGGGASEKTDARPEG